jgi:hypothetical protein
MTTIINPVYFSTVLIWHKWQKINLGEMTNGS